jgi:hypothetical protein
MGGRENDRESDQGNVQANGPGKPSKNRRRGAAALAPLRQKRYIGCNLSFSYDRVLRVGPPGPALFYYLNEAGQNRTFR